MALLSPHLVAFDRFLARLVQAQPGAWMLKGGLALQLRMGSHARTTKDIDVLWTIPRLEMQRVLASAASLDLGDWFAFVVRPWFRPRVPHERWQPGLAG